MKSSPPKVLIRTLLLNGQNYGGILQAYALQRIIEKFNYAPFTDVSQSDAPPTNVMSTSKKFIKSLALEFPFVDARKPEWVYSKIERKINVHLEDFCRKHIVTVRLYDAIGRPDMELTNSFDVMVSGSDQVWRAAYGDVRSYLFDFAQDAGIPKIAYAASFGTASIDDEYDEALVAETAALARRFDAISVREESGVAICAEKWGVSAIQLIDPTMLLDAHHYAALAARSDVRISSGALLTYILDTAPAVEQWTAELGSAIGHIPRKLMPDLPSTLADFRSRPAEFIRPSIFTWLQAIQQAEYVITDSFHGTAFSILLEKPFLVVKNRTRGAARFDTLLRIFGLQDRAVEVGEDAAAKMLAPIEWDNVRQLLELKRQTAMEFLESALSSNK